VRAFLAIEVPPLTAPVPWPRNPERHLTLRFLGEIPPESAGAIAAAVEDAVREVEPFGVVYRSGGMFPDATRPRVAWIGLGEGAEALKQLAGRIDRALVPLGFPPEARPFTPHVTVLRIRGPADAQRARELVGALGDAPLGRDRVEEVVLFESLLSPGGVAHIPRARLRLRTAHSSA
jgi:2'-5' RNA ligase